MSFIHLLTNPSPHFLGHLPGGSPPGPASTSASTHLPPWKPSLLLSGLMPSSWVLTHSTRHPLCARALLNTAAIFPPLRLQELELDGFSLPLCPAVHALLPLGLQHPAPGLFPASVPFSSCPGLDTLRCCLWLQTYPQNWIPSLPFEVVTWHIGPLSLPLFPMNRCVLNCPGRVGEEAEISFLFTICSLKILRWILVSVSSCSS